jgi:membrane protein DedA with SNARE-associated domain
MKETIQFLVHHGYSVIFLWVLFEKMGVPIPVTPILLAAGALAGIGQLSFALVLIVGVMASLLGDLFWYQMGRLRGSKVLSLLCHLSLNPDSCVRRTKKIFTRYGTRSILVTRFIPGLSLVGAPLAGIFHMRPFHFLLFNGIGTFSWVVILVGLGYEFGDEIEHLFTHSKGLSTLIGWIVPIGLAAYFLWKYVQRKRFLHRLSIARIAPEEVKQRLDGGEDLLILDLRSALEFEVEPHTIPGAFHLSIEELEEQHYKIPRDREIVLFCT